jgi:hypothetical protein
MWMKIGSNDITAQVHGVSCGDWGLQKSLVATPLVIFSVAPLVKTIFLDSPVTAQLPHSNAMPEALNCVES